MKALLTQPKWLALHALVLAVAAVMVGLGGWQWDRASGSGGVQNYAYAGQWLLFAAFTVVAYVKLARDEVRPSEPEQAAAPVDLPLRAQPAAPAVPDDTDDELAAYNAYLRNLSEKSS